MASDPAHSYPAELQAALEHALPRMHIAVLNRGIGGQDAPEELARLQADVIAARPQLVIWQVGANGALRNADPEVFDRMVTQGVARLQEAGIDVILMDNQHSPRVDAAPEHGVLNAVLAQVAKATGIGLFSRAGLMAAWDQAGTPPLRSSPATGCTTTIAAMPAWRAPWRMRSSMDCARRGAVERAGSARTSGACGSPARADGAR